MNRRDLLKSAPLLVGAAPLAGAVVVPKLPDVTVDPAKAKLTTADFGDTHIYFDGPTDQLHAMTAGSLRLNPGMVPHPPHQHPEEEMMVIAEGTGEITIAGKPYRVGPGSMMYCQGGKLHGITNTGKTPLLFYFYKWKA